MKYKVNYKELKRRKQADVNEDELRRADEIAALEEKLGLVGENGKIGMNEESSGEVRTATHGAVRKPREDTEKEGEKIIQAFKSGRVTYNEALDLLEG